MNKLIIISYDFPPQDGGIARLCQEIAVGQKEYFDDVIVLTTNKSGASYTYNYDQINRVEFPENRIKCELEMIKYLRALKNKQDYTVLTATWHPEGFLAYVAGFKNFHILAHGTELLSGDSKFRKNIWIPLYAKMLLGKAKSVICNSKYTKSLVSSINNRCNAIALSLAVNSDFFKPLDDLERKDKFTICSVSRIEKFKGHDFIAQVLSKLPPDVRKGIHWNIAGKGPDLDYLKDLTSKLAISDMVTFYGFVADEDLPHFYQTSDLFVLCSREEKSSTSVEGFGLVFLEAQSCGVPAVGTRTGGIPDAIEDGKGGFLIEQDNEEQLSSIILKLFNDRVYLNLKKHEARTRVLNGHTWRHYNEKLYNLIRRQS